MAWSSAAGGLYVFGRLDSGGVAAKCKCNQDANVLHRNFYWELRRLPEGP